MEIIKVRNLSAGFEKRPVLKAVNFSILKDRITVILGKSGCGKSTLLKTMVGLLPPLAGEVVFSSQKIDFNSEKSLQFLYSKVGVLFQNGALLNSLNLYENTALPIRMNHPNLQQVIEKELVFSSLAKVGLFESWPKYPAELSGGMRKRASLARAMILDPEIIFCDEPSAGLDPITSQGLDELMLDLKRDFGMTLVVVTHELRSIEKIADDVIVIKDGGILFSGPFGELFAKKDPFITTFFQAKGQNDD
ncbi:ABC transporter ATP-binding protein [Acidobacteriota bacterium]